MGRPDSFMRLRGEGHDARVQDNIAQTVNPTVQSVNKTPIGGAAAPDWVKLELVGGFANATGQAAAAYHQDALKYVHFKLGVSNAAGCAGGTTLTTLPKGQRPKESISFSVRGTAATAQFLTVAITGAVSVDVAVAAGGTVDGYLSFLAEQ